MDLKRREIVMSALAGGLVSHIPKADADPRIVAVIFLVLRFVLLGRVGRMGRMLRLNRLPASGFVSAILPKASRGRLGSVTPHMRTVDVRRWDKRKDIPEWEKDDPLFLLNIYDAAEHIGLTNLMAVPIEVPRHAANHIEIQVEALNEGNVPLVGALRLEVYSHALATEKIGDITSFTIGIMAVDPLAYLRFGYESGENDGFFLDAMGLKGTYYVSMWLQDTQTGEEISDVHFEPKMQPLIFI